MRRGIILSAIVVLVVFIVGCTQSNVQNVFNSLPQVQSFLSEHKDAEIIFTFWDASEVSSIIEEVITQCEKHMVIQDMYYARISEGNTEISAWFDEDYNPLCIIKRESPEEEVGEVNETVVENETIINLILNYKLINGCVKLSWTPYPNSDLKYYKVVRSVINPNPTYPEDGYIKVISSRLDNTYTDCDPKSGSNYYGITVVKTDGTKIYTNPFQINIISEVEVVTDVTLEGFENDDNCMELSWNPYEEEFKYYKVERANLNTSYAFHNIEAINQDENVNSHVDCNQDRTVINYYRITTVFDDYSEIYSNNVTTVKCTPIWDCTEWTECISSKQTALFYYPNVKPETHGWGYDEQGNPYALGTQSRNCTTVEDCGADIPLVKDCTVTCPEGQLYTGSAGYEEDKYSCYTPICLDNADCADEDECTIDTCTQPGQLYASCQNREVADCNITGIVDCSDETQTNCCGNEVCESNEDCLSCPNDCIFDYSCCIETSDCGGNAFCYNYICVPFSDDQIAPVLHNVWVEVDGSIVKVFFNISDDYSGVKEIFGDISAPAGSYSDGVTFSVYGDYNLSSGLYEGIVEFAEDYVSGSWQLGWIYFKDIATNQDIYYANIRFDYAREGQVPQPVLENMWVEFNDTAFLVFLNVSDNIAPTTAAKCHAQATIKSPSGTWSQKECSDYQYFEDYGIYKVIIDIPGSPESGVWIVDEVILHDINQNINYYYYENHSVSFNYPS